MKSGTSFQIGGTWEPIPGYGRYEASENGLIRSTDYKRTGNPKIIKPSKSKCGYLKSMFLRDDGKYCTRPVHYMVSLAFFGQRPKGTEINHKNGEKTDNRPENLEYVTKSENVLHAYRNGLMTKKRGSLNGMSKLTEDDVSQIRAYREKFVGRYYGIKKLAEECGISEAQIKDIVNRRRNIWPHV